MSSFVPKPDMSTALSKVPALGSGVAKAAGGGLGNLTSMFGSGSGGPGFGGIANTVGKAIGSKISGGMESKGGAMLSGAADIISSTPIGNTPIGAAAVGVAQLAAGGLNRLTGASLNEENIAA